MASSLAAFPGGQTQVTSSSELRIDLSNSQRQYHDAVVGAYLRDLGRVDRRVCTDATVQLRNGGTIPVHLVLLASHSPVIDNFFRQKGSTTIDGTFANPEAVEAIVNFLYYPTLKFNMRQLTELFLVANTWQISSVKSLLEERLQKLSFLQNVVIHCLNIVASNRIRLSTATKSVVLNNCTASFFSIVDDPRFTELAPNAVRELLSLDKLPVRNEFEVAQILLTFLRAPQNRQFAADLFSVVRHEYIGTGERQQLLRAAESVGLGQIFDQLLRLPPTHSRVPRAGRGRGGAELPQQQFASFSQQQQFIGGGVRGHGYTTSSASSNESTGHATLNEHAALPNPFTKEVVVTHHHPSQSPNPYGAQQEQSQMGLNLRYYTRDSLYDINRIPDQFGPRRQQRRGSRTGSKISSSGSGPETLRDIGKISDPFVSQKQIDREHGRTMNKRLISKMSDKEIRRLPPIDHRDSLSGGSTCSEASSTNSADNNCAYRKMQQNSYQRQYSASSLADLRSVPPISQQGDCPTTGVSTCRSFNTQRDFFSPQVVTPPTPGSQYQFPMGTINATPPMSTSPNPYQHVNLNYPQYNSQLTGSSFNGIPPSHNSFASGSNHAYPSMLSNTCTF